VDQRKAYELLIIAAIDKTLICRQSSNLCAKSLKRLT